MEEERPIKVIILFERMILRSDTNTSTLDDVSNGASRTVSNPLDPQHHGQGKGIRMNITSRLSMEE